MSNCDCVILFRPMKRGEIGCFLSHHSIWKRVSYMTLKKTIMQNVSWLNQNLDTRKC